jgi:GDP-4-dehydro-6-deoxy-D-mannose reductase
LAAEVAALEVHRRTGLRVMVARTFPHTGPGQDDRFVVPVAARDAQASSIKVGNLEPVRELLHVADVVRAYVLLLGRGVAGETYNVASGEGVGLRDLLDRMMGIVGYRVVPESDPTLSRAADIPHLVGDPGKLEATTGWKGPRPFS